MRWDQCGETLESGFKEGRKGPERRSRAERAERAERAWRLKQAEIYSSHIDTVKQTTLPSALGRRDGLSL